MKKIISITILIIAIVVGLKVKSMIDEAPYKDAVNSTVSLMKQGKLFLFRDRLDDTVYADLSIEDIVKFLDETYISHILKITWSDISHTDGNYTLSTELIQEDDTKLPAEFGLYLDQKQQPHIYSLKVGNIALKPKKFLLK